MEYTTISVPKPIADKIKSLIEGTGFTSVSDFIIHVIRDLITAKELEKENNLTSEEVNKIRQRLHALGYL